MLLPGRAVPDPGVVELCACASTIGLPAKKDNALAGCIVSHAGIRTGRRCYRWTLFNPDLTVPVPGIVEASAAEEHSHAMLRVIGHATPLARGWKHDWIL